MRRFLITSGIILFITLLLVAGVYVYVLMSVSSSQSSVTEPTEPSAPRETDIPGTDADERTGPTVPPAGIPLRDLPLSEGQRDAVALVGIDAETFVITPAMQTCAEGKLGAARMAAIIAGEAPTFVEVTKMVPCLNVD